MSLDDADANPPSGDPAPRASAALIVEDDVALRSLLAMALHADGCRVWEAGLRAEALAQLREHPEIDVALIDLGLPPAPHAPDEGLALLAALGGLGRPVKCVVLTGQDQEAAALAAIRAGAFDFLAKPAALEAIRAAVARARLFAAKERQLERAGLLRLQIDFSAGEGLKAVRAEAEERLIRRVLQETGFNVAQTARRLGVKRENVYYFLKKFGLEREAAE